VNVATDRRIVGFDRKIQLDWLDATADWAAEGLPSAAIRSNLSQFLQDKVAGSGRRGAREKTITVLTHIWANVPNSIKPLRDEALSLIENRSGLARLPLHWGMALATYPFFGDVASMTGRLIGLQGTAALSQITRRMTEAWGDRGIVLRATRHVVRTMVLWGVMQETVDPGVYRGSERLTVKNRDGLGTWLVRARVVDPRYRPVALTALLESPALFPYRLIVSRQDLASHPSLELERQGMDGEVVVGKGDR